MQWRACTTGVSQNLWLAPLFGASQNEWLALSLGVFSHAMWLARLLGISHVQWLALSLGISQATRLAPRPRFSSCSMARSICLGISIHLARSFTWGFFLFMADWVATVFPAVLGTEEADCQSLRLSAFGVAPGELGTAGTAAPGPR